MERVESYYWANLSLGPNSGERHKVSYDNGEMRKSIFMSETKPISLSEESNGGPPPSPVIHVYCLIKRGQHEAYYVYKGRS